MPNNPGFNQKTNSLSTSFYKKRYFRRKFKRSVSALFGKAGSYLNIDHEIFEYHLVYQSYLCYAASVTGSRPQP